MRRENIVNKYNRRINAILMALLAAVLYGISSPVSKILLTKIPPTLMAALLYLGAGAGMLAVNRIQLLTRQKHQEAKITKKELPYTVGMILLDIAAPILLMVGLSHTNAANASLLNNFEIVATSILALGIFKETIGKRMWLAITLITLSSIVLTVNDISGGFSFNLGSIFILFACICWGFENNFTRMLSIKNPLQIVIIKGFGSGLGSLLISFADKQFCTDIIFILVTLLLGFVAYGLSIFFYIYAQRELGAARTSAFYALAPFIGVMISWVIFRGVISLSFIAALLIMVVGTYFAVTEKHNHLHTHLQVTHEHRHNHMDGHHNHTHSPQVLGEHCHVHTHETVTHVHTHTPDTHHSHSHS